MRAIPARRPLHQIPLRLSLAMSLLIPVAAQEVQPQGATPEEAAVIEEFAAMLDRLGEAGSFSGTALLARGDEVLFEVAYGLASRRYGIPNEISTRFNMGSMNKMFTGVAICQLVEQKRLAFSDSIIEHLPDYPNKEVAEVVTIHHLLSHTSGMGSYFGEAYVAALAGLETISDLLPLFVDDPLQFEPGSSWSYSNSGPVVLGLIIEAVTGQSYFEYVEEHVLAPAGMTETGHWPLHDPVPDLAMGYTKMTMTGQRLQEWRNNAFIIGPLASPAGGAYTNVRDMLRFSRALQSGKLLSQEMFQTMTEGRSEMGRGMKYGYLHGDMSRNGVHALGHNGGGPGISCDFSYFPEAGYTLVLLSNIDGGASGPSRFLKGKLFDLAVQQDGH